jgi:hypothetical protein
VISAATGGSWAMSKLMSRLGERLNSQSRRVDLLEDQVNRMPLDYVLKVDFLREIQEMHNNFREINNKLDKLMEKLLSK